MTTGNVSSAQMIAVSIIKQGNTIFQDGAQVDTFQSFISNIASTGDDTVKAVSDTKVTSNKTRDELTTSYAESKDSTISKEDVEGLASDIKDAVKDALEITDEELEQAMAELGITVADLLVPQNIVNLVAEVKDISALDILTDETLGKLISDLTSDISQMVNAFMADNNIDFEQIVDNLKEIDVKESAETDEAVVDETESNVHKVMSTESENGEVIEVTVEDNRVTSEKTVTKGEVSTEGTDNKAPVNDETANNGTNEDLGKGSEKDNLSFADKVIQNITEAVSRTTENFSQVAEVYKVDGADIIRQMMDVVKVNLSNDMQSIEIQLTPEHLGKINLSVVANNGVMTASITTQNETVKAVIESQLVQLKEQLNNQGIKVQDVEVTVASHGFDANMNENGSNNNDSRPHAGRRFRGINEIPSDEPVAADEMNLTDNNINLMA